MFSYLSRTTTPGILTLQDWLVPIQVHKERINLLYKKKLNWFENIKKRNILSGIFWNEVFILSNLFIYLFIHSFVDIVNKFLGRKGNVLRSSCVGVLIKIVRFIIVKTMFASKKGC